MSSAESGRKAQRQADIASVKSLVEYLQNVVSHPAKYADDAPLQSALRSQGALAKYPISAASVHPMSLNHQRLIADLSVGGFETIDRLRKSAVNALATQKFHTIKGGSANSKKGLAAKISELELDNSLLKQDLLLLQRAYDLRCLQARNYASFAGSAIQELCAKEQREISATFSLRRKRIESHNVVPFDANHKS
ncbi:hypothetical protein [Lysobacter capsici]|uniref:hypothetical protein n=1 Tax=Lysobacter capsici TaxID=435897 RepID=UPI0006274946|nr:hypothetical protein [Lysobacter capsici]